MAIRWDKKYTKKVQRIVKNYNQRLKYQESFGSQYLPDHVDIKYIKDVFNKRQDLNRYLRQLERFNAKSAEVVKVGKDNVKMTKWAKQNLISDRASARAKIKKAMAQTVKRQGRKMYAFQRGDNYLTMKSELKRLSRPLKSLSYSSLQSNEAIARKYRELHKRNKVFKKNFLDMLLKDTIQSKTNPEQTGRIMEKLENLSPEQLLKMYDDNPNLKYIVEHYHLYTAEEHDATLDEAGKMLLEDELDIIEATIDNLIEKYATL